MTSYQINIWLRASRCVYTWGTIRPIWNDGGWGIFLKRLSQLVLLQ